MTINCCRAKGSDCSGRAKGSIICNVFNTKCVNCEPYNAKVACCGFHSGTKSYGQSTSSGKNFPLCHQLEINNGGSVGPTYSTGIPYSFQGRTSPNAPSSTLPIFGGSDESFTRGSDFVGEERSGGDSGSLRFGDCEWFYSTLFLVPKSEGRMRPVINLKSLNFWVRPQHFKMEGIHTLREIVAQDDWLAKLDLKDAYFTVPIDQEHRMFLRFVVDQVPYQFTCLPFSLSCAPWAFTKVLKPVAAFLRGLGVRLIVYIDDMLVIGKSPAETRDHVEALIVLLEGLGFIINRGSPC